MSAVAPLLIVAGIAAVGCGAAAEPSGSSRGNNVQSVVAAPVAEDEPSATNEAILGAPEKVANPPAGAGAVPLHLYVSNQSFEMSPVGIDVWIDQVHAIRGGFAVEGQHNWILFDFQLDAGSHQLRAESLDGVVVIDATLAVPAERWGVLDFWYYPGEPTHPMFTWSLHDSQVGFN